MIFIFGFEQGEKELDFDKLVICKCCSKYGHIKVYVTYSYFTLFFIPLFKWGKRYFVKMSCCSSQAEISKELGRAIEKGEVEYLDPDSLDFKGRENAFKCCSKCGYITIEDFDFCPKCGEKL